MDIRILQELQQVSRLEALLESFATDIHYVPSTARAILEREELPHALRKLTCQQLENEAWRAWTDEQQLWFITGRISPSLTRLRDHAAMHVFFYSDSGNVVSSGIWAMNAQGHWRLCVASDSDTPYR
jgi:hypothetical protein